MAFKKSKAEARILWKGKQLGLMLVNQEGESLFIYDNQILSMWENLEELIEVKTRDRNPEKAINYHPGDIWGVIKDGGRARDDDGNVQDSLKIVLYFGEAERSMKFDAQKCLPIHYVDIQTYLVPKSALEILIKAIKVMTQTKDSFDVFLNYAKTRPVSRKPQFRECQLPDDTETRKNVVDSPPRKKVPTHLIKEKVCKEENVFPAGRPLALPRPVPAPDIAVENVEVESHVSDVPATLKKLPPAAKKTECVKDKKDPVVVGKAKIPMKEFFKKK